MSEKKQQKQYYYSSGDQRIGPMSGQQLKQLANIRQIKPSDLIWEVGSEKKYVARDIPGFLPAGNESREAATKEDIKAAHSKHVSSDEGSDNGSSRRYLLRVGGMTHGPYSKPDLQGFAARGKIMDDFEVSEIGSERWFAVRDSEFRELAFISLQAQRQTQSSKEEIEATVIRTRRYFARTRVVAVYADRLVIGTRYFSKLKVLEEAFEKDGYPILRRALHHSKEIKFEKIRSVIEYLPRGTLPSKMTNDFRNTATTEVDHGSFWKSKYSLQLAQTPGLRDTISCRIGNRYFIGNKSPMLLALLLSFLAFLVALPSFVLARFEEYSLAAAAAIGLIYFVVHLIVASRMRVKLTTEEWKSRSTSPPPQKPQPSRKRANPFRSPFLGWSLKIAAVVYWIVIASPITDPLTEFMDEHFKNNINGQQMIWTLVWAPSAMLMYTGYRLCQKQLQTEGKGDTRKPIVFLRPFEDDGATSLQPTGLFAKVSGARADAGVPYGAQNMNNPASGRTSLVNLFWSVTPQRLLRLFFNIGVDTSEESLCRFFESYGPVTAIGSPSETLPTPGAQRTYSDDIEWKNVASQALSGAQAVIVQPGESEGVKWELDYLKKNVEPFRILLCLTGYWGDPERYDRMRQIIKECFDVQLPRAVPFSERAAFVWFDKNWNLSCQYVSYKNRMLWPVTGDATDLRYTLHPFLQGMHGGEREAPRDPKWSSPWSLSCMASDFCAVLIAILIAIGPTLALRGLFAQTTSRVPSNADVMVRQQVIKGKREELSGKAQPYSFSIPESLVNQKIEDNQIEYHRKSPDGRFSIQVIASVESSDITNLAQQRLQANSGEGIKLSALGSIRNVKLGESYWTRVRIDVELTNGLKVTELCQATPDGTVLVVVHVVEVPGEEVGYFQLADDTLDSFRFRK